HGQPMVAGGHLLVLLERLNGARHIGHHVRAQLLHDYLGQLHVGQVRRVEAATKNDDPPALGQVGHHACSLSCSVAQMPSSVCTCSASPTAACWLSRPS